MKDKDGVRSLLVRVLRLIGLNVLIGLMLASILYWVNAGCGQHRLPEQLSSSFIHSIIYGLMFGLAMPYLGERFAALSPLWSRSLIILALLVISASASLVIQLTLLAFRLLAADNFWPEFFYKSSTVFIISLLIGLSINAYEKVSERIQATNLQLRTQELEKEQALKLATEARLASLESKLRPHFLFNTLNSVSALIQEDAQAAEKMVERLASLLRKSLDNSSRNCIPLCEEIRLAIDYLEIERARFHERLGYSVDVSAGVNSLPVPPFTIQPLVENSIKFAVSPKVEGGEIRIRAYTLGGRLELEVSDDGPGFDLEAIPRGHGLDNLQSRLAALFGDDACLSVSTEKGRTGVRVRIPLNGHEAR